jgi:nucleoside-diphosphate-sugar epimerase
MADTILIAGALGQLGSELTQELRILLGKNSIIAADLAQPTQELTDLGPYEQLDITNDLNYASVIDKYKITQVYHLAALLSATGEKYPNKAWDVNLNGYRNLLEIAKEKKQIAKIYFPSSIAVFGLNTPRINTPQDTPVNPNTMYGITKYTGELLSQYYWQKFQVDIRSLRYPGIISYKTLPGGGTTDYAVDIYHHAVQGKNYECFLKPDTALPMMYMPDALKATFQIMDAPQENIKQRMGYNLSAMSFTPETQASAIKKIIPEFTITYNPDFRQAIADSWPASIDDSAATHHWGWKPAYDLHHMSIDMIHNLKTQYSSDIL